MWNKVLSIEYLLSYTMEDKIFFLTASFSKELIGNSVTREKKLKAERKKYVEAFHWLEQMQQLACSKVGTDVTLSIFQISWLGTGTVSAVFWNLYLFALNASGYESKSNKDADFFWPLLKIKKKCYNCWIPIVGLKNKNIWVWCYKEQCCGSGNRSDPNLLVGSLSNPKKS